MYIIPFIKYNMYGIDLQSSVSLHHNMNVLNYSYSPRQTAAVFYGFLLRYSFLNNASAKASEGVIRTYYLFALSNIPYFLCKVNALNRSLTFFVHHVYFQLYFFGNNNINPISFFEKLQNGKRRFNAKSTNNRRFFMPNDHEIKIRKTYLF